MDKRLIVTILVAIFSTINVVRMILFEFYILENNWCAMAFVTSVILSCLSVGVLIMYLIDFLLGTEMKEY